MHSVHPARWARNGTGSYERFFVFGANRRRHWNHRGRIFRSAHRTLATSGLCYPFRKAARMHGTVSASAHVDEHVRAGFEANVACRADRHPGSKLRT